MSVVLFTDRARKVMILAYQEAQRFSHEHVGTGHLLLGLIKEGSGVAAHVLKNLGVNYSDARCKVENLLFAVGPGSATLGKLPYSPGAEKVLQYSLEEAPRP